MVPVAYASSEGSDEPARPRKIASATHRRNVDEGAAIILGNIAPLSGCEFKNSKALKMIATSQNSLYLPHVCRLCYMRRSACAPYSLISTFVSRTKHQTFCQARAGPKLSAKLVCHSLFGRGGGCLPGTANCFSRRQGTG